jgi:hypothetical protein
LVFVCTELLADCTTIDYYRGRNSQYLRLAATSDTGYNWLITKVNLMTHGIDTLACGVSCILKILCRDNKKPPPVEAVAFVWCRKS